MERDYNHRNSIPVNGETSIMMTTEQINNYLNKNKVVDEPKVEDTKANVEDTKVQETNTVEASEENTNTGSEDENKVENETQPVETKPEDKPAEKKEKHQYTKQEKIDYAFQKAKAKQKKLEARIRELEEENKKFKEKKLEDFGDSQEDKINFLVDKRENERELARLQQEVVDNRNSEASRIHEQRTIACFPDEAEQEKYKNLIRDYGPAFVKQLDEVDPEQVVLGYLDDCDISPILTRILMTNKEYRDSVLNKTSPYSKQRAMEQLEAKVRWAQQQLNNRKQKETTPPTTPVETKPSIPVVGSVTKSESSSDGVQKDMNSLLTKLNQRKHYR